MLSQNGILYLRTSREELLSYIFLCWWTELIIQILSKGTEPCMTTEQLWFTTKVITETAFIEFLTNMASQKRKN